MLQGWSRDDWANGQGLFATAIPNKVLVSLAGNAFAAYSIGPLLLSAIPMIGETPNINNGEISVDEQSGDSVDDSDSLLGEDEELSEEASDADSD